MSIYKSFLASSIISLSAISAQAAPQPQLSQTNPSPAMLSMNDVIDVAFDGFSLFDGFEMRGIYNGETNEISLACIDIPDHKERAAQSLIKKLIAKGQKMSLSVYSIDYDDRMLEIEGAVYIQGKNLAQYLMENNLAYIDDDQYENPREAEFCRMHKLDSPKFAR